ncbi:hypothetical protein ACFVS9_07295 [Streptomyces sp. NPDC058008]|uniref:hypothetical protein n=1 Tax=Streptomyces sp. NPDC058008 TaxID=3346303 RepID=UPI0036EEBD2A
MSAVFSESTSSRLHTRNTGVSPPEPTSAGTRVSTANRPSGSAVTSRTSLSTDPLSRKPMRIRSSGAKPPASIVTLASTAAL